MTIVYIPEKVRTCALRLIFAVSCEHTGNLKRVAILIPQGCSTIVPIEKGSHINAKGNGYQINPGRIERQLIEI